MEPKWTFEGHQLGIVSVATNHTGTGKQSHNIAFLVVSCVDAVGASSGLDGGIRTWDLTTGECVRSIDGGPVDVWTLTFSPDSQVHISYPDSSEVQWNLSLRTPLK